MRMYRVFDAWFFSFISYKYKSIEACISVWMDKTSDLLLTSSVFSEEPEHTFNQMIIIDKILSDDVNYQKVWYKYTRLLYRTWQGTDEYEIREFYSFRFLLLLCLSV